MQMTVYSICKLHTADFLANIVKKKIISITESYVLYTG